MSVKMNLKVAALLCDEVRHNRPKFVIHGLAWVFCQSLGRHFGSFIAPYYASYFPFVSRNYLSSGLFVFLLKIIHNCPFAHSCIFLICSNPGLASLSSTAKTKLSQHNNVYFSGFNFLYLPTKFMKMISSLWSTLSCEYLREFSKKIRNGPNGILRGLGETDS